MNWKPKQVSIKKRILFYTLLFSSVVSYAIECPYPSSLGFWAFAVGIGGIDFYFVNKYSKTIKIVKNTKPGVALENIWFY